MLKQRLKEEISALDKRWNKLIFLCNTKESFSYDQIHEKTQYLNVNLLVSESLMHVPVKRYPLEVERIIKESIQEKEGLFFLDCIDILFSPELKIDPIRLLENISKQNAIIVRWPGVYSSRSL